MRLEDSWARVKDEYSDLKATVVDTLEEVVERAGPNQCCDKNRPRDGGLSK